jgi:hypothetical protein
MNVVAYVGGSSLQLIRIRTRRNINLAMVGGLEVLVVESS